jgi:hypothetical protein
MSHRASRLYRKRSGVYWLRIVLPRGVTTSRRSAAEGTLATTSSDNSRLNSALGGQSSCTSGAANCVAPQTPPNRLEIRRSLRTTSCRKATTLISIINAALTLAPPERWEMTVSKLLGDFGCGWTLPGGLSASDDDDQRRLQRFFEEEPAFREAALKAVQQAATTAIAMAEPGKVHHPAYLAGAIGIPASSASDFAPAANTIIPGAVTTGTTSLPRNPQRLSDARAWFKQRRALQDAKKKNSTGRTVEDQDAELLALAAFLEPTLGTNPWIHEIQTHHLANYIDHLAKRPGRRKDENGLPKPLSAPRVRIVAASIEHPWGRR